MTRRPSRLAPARLALLSGLAAVAVLLALAPLTPSASAAATDYQAEDATISQGVV
jgi:hypothetical protein